MADLTPFEGKTVLITGARGMLGRAFHEMLAAEAPRCRTLALGRERLDVTSREDVLALAVEKPDFIIHCAGDVDADRCEDHPTEAERSHVGGTLNVAELAGRCGAKVLYPQSFLIFAEEASPVTELTAPAPLSVYGRCKLQAETVLRERLPESLIIRMGGFFGGDEADKNFVGKFTRSMAKRLEEGVPISLEVGDRVWQPTYTADLAANGLLLLARGAGGIYGMASHGRASFFDVAKACVEALGLQSRVSIRPLDAASLSSRERAVRPRRVVLDNARLRAEGLDRQRPWRTTLNEYLARPYFRGMFAASLR